MANYLTWTDSTGQKARIKQFKLPLGPADAKHDPLAIVIVKSMLLTGFDAPVAQALYLDRLIQEAELLQAIARVNRTGSDKRHGLVVDYFGVSTQLSGRCPPTCRPTARSIPTSTVRSPHSAPRSKS